jgi:YQGE family putative transporter
MPTILPNIKPFNKQISSTAFKVIILHLMFILGTILTSSFIHVFLWRLRNDLGYIAYFDLAFVAATLCGYIISAYLLTIIKSDRVFRISFLFITITYILVLYWQENLIEHILLLGCVNGLGNGLYWGAYNILKLRQTTNQNREYYFGIIQGSFTIMATLFPAIAGFIIVYLPRIIDLTYAGYYLLYALSTAIFLIMAGYVEALPKFKTKRFKLNDVLKLTNSKLFRDISLYELLAGFYETGSKMVLVVFSFIILKNEFNLGLFSSIFGLLSGLYIYFVGRKIDIRKRAEIILIGALFIFIGRLIFIYFLDVQALALDRLMETVGGPLFGLPTAAVILSTIEGRSNFKLEKEQEYLVASEIPLNFGRFFGSLFFIILAFLFGSYNTSMIKMWFFVVSATIIIQWYFVKKLTV